MYFTVRARTIIRNTILMNARTIHIAVTIARQAVVIGGRIFSKVKNEKLLLRTRTTGA